MAKLKSEKHGLLHENKALSALLESRTKEHETQLADLVQKQASEKKTYIERNEALAKEKGDALAEVRSLRVALESAYKGCKNLEMERDRLQKEVRDSEGLRKERDAALAEARGSKADLANAHQILKRTTKEKAGLAEALRASESRMAACRGDLESVRKERDAVRKQNESVRKEYDDVRSESESVRQEMESVRKEVGTLREELEREKVARERAAAEADKAESARARARKDLEAALTRLVESQRARAGLQRELAEGLEVLAGVRRHQEAAEKAYRERVFELEDEVRRLRATGVAGFGGFGRTAGQTSAQGGVTSVGLGTAGSDGCQAAESDSKGIRRAHTAQPGFGVFGNTPERLGVNIPERLGVNASVAGEATRGGPTFLAEEPAPKIGVPGFELGSGDCVTGGKRNPLGNRRKVLVARRPAVKKEIGPGDEARRLGFTNLAVTAFGSPASGMIAGHHQELGRSFAGPSEMVGRPESGDDTNGASRCEKGEAAAEGSKWDCDRCRAKIGGVRGGGSLAESGSKVPEEKRARETMQLRRLMSCLKKQVQMDALFGTMLQMEQRRVSGFGRLGRNAAGSQGRRSGRFPGRSARRPVPELLPLVALLISARASGI